MICCPICRAGPGGSNVCKCGFIMVADGDFGVFWSLASGPFQSINLENGVLRVVCYGGPLQSRTVPIPSDEADRILSEAVSHYTARLVLDT